MKIQNVAIGLIACLAGTAATAGNFYVGGGVGRGGIDLECTEGYECDTYQAGYKLYGGYKLTQELSLEVSYINYGKVTFTVPSVPGFKADSKVTGYGGGVAWRTEFAPKWLFVGRVGLGNVKVSYDKVFDTAADENVKLYGGVGIGYSFTPNLTLEASWDFSNAEASNGVADGRSVNGRVDLLSLSLTVGF